MTVYTTVPLDDSNLDVTVTESADLVSIDIKPASFTGSGGGGGGAVSSVNAKIGIVVLDTDDIGEGTTNEYYTDARAQTLINTLPIAYTNADLTMSGNILPSIDSDGTTGYDLGSPTKKWKDLYLSEGSLYIDNQKVIESDSGTIVVRADVDQSLQTTVTGTGVLTLSSETTINVDSTLQMGPGKKITTSNGDPVEFGDKLNLDNNQIINVADPTAAGHASTKGYVDTALFNLVNGAPTQLDTLGEIANSLGDDAAFSTTMTTALALKDTIVDVNTKDANTLSSANTYTDTSIAAIPAVDLTPYSTTVQVEALPVSTFTNDAGYLTTETDSQTLSFANPNLTISNGNVVDLSSLTPTVPVTSVNTLIGAVVLDTDNIAEGSTNLYHTTPRVQAVIDTNTAGFVTASDIHSVTDDGVDAPNMSTALSNNKFQLKNTSALNSGALNIESYRNLSSNQVQTLKFKTNNNKEFISFAQSGAADDGNNITNYSTFWGNHNILHSRAVNGGADSSMYYRASNLHFDATSINFNNNFTFPNADGTVDQVMSTDGAGNLSWVTAGGGGATALSDLSDVAELNLQNNDLLMYNISALEWQNTNLGISVAPALTGDATSSLPGAYTLTVTNHDTYDDPAYFCELYTDTGTLTLQNSVFTNNGDGTITVVMTGVVAGDYQFRIRCQDFGDLQSEITTKDVTFEEFGGTFRYWRMTNMAVEYTSGWTRIDKFLLWTGSAASGSSYPSLMTSANTPTPYVASASFTYTPSSPGYDPYRTFDNSANYWWSIGSTATTADWLQIDLGSSIAVKCFQYKSYVEAYAPKTLTLLASNTGAFAGEETTIYAEIGIPFQNTMYTIG
jgi:hypothetical protein